MPRSCIKTLDTLDFGIPRSASSSHTVSHWALLIAACTRSTISGVLRVPCLTQRGLLLQMIDHLWSICAMAFWIIQMVSMEECSSLTQSLMQIHCSTCLVIFNVMAKQHTCSLNVIYNPHWLVQWSLYCSFMCIPVHSPRLPGYIDVTQTVLLISTMTGLFPDTSCIHNSWNFFWKDLVQFLVGVSWSFVFLWCQL